MGKFFDKLFPKLMARRRSHISPTAFLTLGTSQKIGHSFSQCGRQIGFACRNFIYSIIFFMCVQYSNFHRNHHHHHFVPNPNHITYHAFHLVHTSKHVGGGMVLNNFMDVITSTE